MRQEGLGALASSCELVGWGAWCTNLRDLREQHQGVGLSPGTFSWREEKMKGGGGGSWGDHIFDFLVPGK